MSISHYVFEHLTVKKNEKDEDSSPVSVMIGQLSALAAVMLADDYNAIHRLKLIADGTEYTYSGAEITPAFREILKAMSEAKEIDFLIDYRYVWRFGWQMYDLLGPFVLTEFFEKADEDEDLSNAFYCAWYSEESDEGPGVLVAFGEKDGKTYSGPVEWKEVSSIPEGIWDENFAAPILVESDDPIDIAQYPEFLETCRELNDLGHDTFFEYDKEGITFYLNNITMKTQEQKEKYVALCRCLRETAPENIETLIIKGAFLDCSGEYPRIMTVEHDGKDVVIEVAEV